MVYRTLTSPNFNVFRIDSPAWWQSPPFTRSVPLIYFLHWLAVKFRILVKISLLAYNTIHEKQLVFLHSMLTPSLPSRSLRSSNGISLSVPRVKTNTGARAFHSLEKSCRCLSIQPFQLLPSRDTLDLGHRHTWCHGCCAGVDATELFHRFCSWTLIRLSRHWAWPRRVYWRYRSLIDWFLFRTRY